MRPPAAAAAAAVDPVALTRALVRCRSVTPTEGGALVLLHGVLAAAGFRCTRVDRAGVSNLYARWGSEKPVFAFCGHTDVVPVGEGSAWSVDPFAGEIRDGRLVGRGAADMKSGVAAFVSAACAYAASPPASPEAGSIALLITGDEEGPAEHGVRALIDWMRAEGEEIDHCLVGEPTSIATLGDAIKIGRRGSLGATIRATGRQGHVAYPSQAANPLPALARFLDRVASAELDQGSPHFQPSTLALTTVDVGNAATNVIPAEARAALNIRFNDTQSPEGLTAWLQHQAEAASGGGVEIRVDTRLSGPAFLTAPGRFVDIAVETTAATTGRRPTLSTGGGTSDARFIKDLCPVIELGLTGASVHGVDESVAVAEIRGLSDLYLALLRRYFPAFAEG